MKLLRVVLPLIVLCVLVTTQAGAARADEFPPPSLPPSQPLPEPITQWGSFAPSVSLPSPLLPEMMPGSWANHSIVLPSFQWGSAFQPMSLPSASLLNQTLSPWLNFSPAAPIAWNVPAASMSLLPAALPQPMSGTWGNPSLAASLQTLPALDLSQAALQPLTQWTPFDGPTAQIPAPRLIGFPDTGTAFSSYPSPVSSNVDLMVNTLANSAAFDARWQSEDLIMSRDLILTTKLYRDFIVAAMTGDFLPLLETEISLGLNSRPLDTAMSISNVAGAGLTGGWRGALSEARQWALDAVLFQTPSAQAMVGPFVSAPHEMSQLIRGPYVDVYSQASVQVTFQPVFSRDPTGWLVFPDSYVETKTIRSTTWETQGSLTAWTGSYQSHFAMPSSYGSLPAWNGYGMQTYRSPSSYTPYVPTYTPYVPSYTPYVPSYTPYNPTYTPYNPTYTPYVPSYTPYVPPPYIPPPSLPNW